MSNCQIEVYLSEHFKNWFILGVVFIVDYLSMNKIIE